MKKKLLLIGILLLPTLMYIYFSLGVPHAFRAPFFGPRHAIQVTDKNGNPKTDTAYFTIPQFTCTTVGGAAFQSTRLDSHLYVAIFVRPDSMTSQLPMLANDLKLNRDKYAFARFIFFYPGDSAGNPPAMAPDIAAELGLHADTAYTLFLPPATFDTLHSKYYFVPDPARKKDPWTSWSDGVLIDHKRRIRGYYDIRTATDLKRLKEDVPFIFKNDEAVKTIENSNVEQKRK